jgi:hypothetical protein
LPVGRAGETATLQPLAMNDLGVRLTDPLDFHLGLA